MRAIPMITVIPTDIIPTDIIPTGIIPIISIPMDLTSVFATGTCPAIILDCISITLGE